MNILIDWSLTGIWNGSSANFLVWGLMFAVLLVIEKMWLLKRLEQTKIWNHFYVLFTVMISFVIFNAADMREALAYLASMFGLAGIPFVSAEFIYYLKSYGVLLTAAVVGATPAVKLAAEWMMVRIREKQYGPAALSVLQTFWMLLLLVVCTAYLIDSSFNPFLYFRF